MKNTLWCQRSMRMDRLVRDDRKTTVTQITTRYNQGIRIPSLNAQQRRTLKADGLQQQKEDYTVLGYCGGYFLGHTLGPLVPIDHRFNTTAYLSVVADHVHSLYDYSVPSSNGSFQQYIAPCHKSSQDWFLEHDNEFTLLKWPPVTRSKSNRGTFGMWWNGRFSSWMCSRQICSNCVTLSCHMDQYLWGMFPTPCWIYATKNWGSSEGKTGSNPILVRCT